MTKRGVTFFCSRLFAKWIIRAYVFYGYNERAENKIKINGTNV